jgi:hypothetical protein
MRNVNPSDAPRFLGGAKSNSGGTVCAGKALAASQAGVVQPNGVCSADFVWSVSPEEWITDGDMTRLAIVRRSLPGYSSLALAPHSLPGATRFTFTLSATDLMSGASGNAQVWAHT